MVDDTIDSVAALRQTNPRKADDSRNYCPAALRCWSGDCRYCQSPAAHGRSRSLGPAHSSCGWNSTHDWNYSWSCQAGRRVGSRRVDDWPRVVTCDSRSCPGAHLPSAEPRSLRSRCYAPRLRERKHSWCEPACARPPGPARCAPSRCDSEPQPKAYSRGRAEQPLQNSSSDSALR